MVPPYDTLAKAMNGCYREWSENYFELWQQWNREWNGSLIYFVLCLSIQNATEMLCWVAIPFFRRRVRIAHQIHYIFLFIFFLLILFPKNQEEIFRTLHFDSHEKELPIGKIEERKPNGKVYGRCDEQKPTERSVKRFNLIKLEGHCVCSKLT